MKTFETTLKDHKILPKKNTFLLHQNTLSHVKGMRDFDPQSPKPVLIGPPFFFPL